LGPVDNFAFSRLASIWDSVDIKVFETRTTAPKALCAWGMLLRTRVWIAGARGEGNGVGQGIDWMGDGNLSGIVTRRVAIWTKADRRGAVLRHVN
jgi:hypothetical protein